MSDAAAETFAAERAHLLAVAYRMLGTMSDAEDAVQECYLRVRDIAPATLASPRAFFTTVVTRICLDLLRAARVRRQEYAGPWLPEPVRSEGVVDTESIAMAFLVVLETLSPEERAIYLLCEVFDHSHAEVATILGKSVEACRQALHRAKQRVAAGRPRFAPSSAEQARLVGGFLRACSSGDVDGLRALLSDDIVVWADGGGKVSAARRPVAGSDACARFLVGLARRMSAAVTIEVAEMNGAPAVILRLDGRAASVLVLELTRAHGDVGCIGAVRIVRNPDKLSRV